MARRIEVEIVGDSRSLERAFQRSERSAKSFNQTMATTGRTMSSRAGIGGGILPFGGAGLAATAGAGAALLLGKNIVAASREAEVILGQTSVAVEDAGLSWTRYAAQVDAAATRISKATAFDDEAVLQSFQVFVRGQKNVARSLELSELAADVARGRYTDLASATQLVNKAAMGQIGALRRAGIAIDANATSAQALDALLKAYGGSAAKYSESAASSSDRLAVSWENLEEKAGGPLSRMVGNIADGLNLAVGAMNRFDSAQANAMSDEDLARIRALGDEYQLLKDKWLGGPLDPNVAQSAAALGKGVFGVGRGGALTTPGAGFGANKPTPPFQFGGTKPATIEQQNAWFDAMIGRQEIDVQDIATAQGQIERLRQINATLTARIAITSDITRKLKLEDEIKANARAIRGLQEGIAADVLASAQSDKAAADEAKRLAIETARGWLDFGVERAQATDTIKDDLRAYRAVEAAIKERIAQEGRTLDLVRDLWRTRQKIKDLNTSQSKADPLAGLMQVSSKKLTDILSAGTGLSAAGRRAMQANVSGAEIQPLHVHVNIDGREIGRAATGYQAREGRRTARQTSGLRH